MANEDTGPKNAVDTSDDALANLLMRLKATTHPNEVRRLSEEIEQIVFHKQFMNG